MIFNKFTLTVSCALASSIPVTAICVLASSNPATAIRALASYNKSGNSFSNFTLTSMHAANLLAVLPK